MRARVLMGTVLSAAVASGCYASHGPEDVTRCAPEGVHTVMAEATSTECGVVASSEIEVTIPPAPETIFGGGPVAEVVQVGPCRWEVSGAEAAPDLSLSIDGVIDTSDGTVRGDFEVEISGIGGPCTTHLEWTEAE